MPAAAALARRRHDPGRRRRIIAACLDVIARHGVAGTTHRKVAEAADVPLGSMTYHFDGMRELLHEAFTRFAVTSSEQLEARMAAAKDVEMAKQLIAEAISGVVQGRPRDLVLTHELYALAARDPSFRGIANAWMARSRRVLERHFDPPTARILDALVEGLAIHEALDNQPHDPAIVTTAIDLVTARS